MQMLMFNKNNTLKKAFSQSVIQTSKKFLTTAEEEPTDQPPVRHFDPGAPLLVPSKYQLFRLIFYARAVKC